MKNLQYSWQSLVAILLCIGAALTFPLIEPGSGDPILPGISALIFFMIIISCFLSQLTLPPAISAAILFLAAHEVAWLLLTAITGNEGAARLSFFLLLASAWLLAWRCVSILSDIRPHSRFSGTVLRLLIPAIFGAWILIIWEAATRGAGIPFIILPPPSAIAVRIASSLPILAADVRQTIFKAVIAGYVIGCISGFLVAILADRFAFLRRGLMPIANLASALPIIGVAPIMVMWFGFDWQSKAAVVTIMTFFPMLVNTVAGLAASGAIERDLMRTYASSYTQTLFKLRLPAAAPFIFNALKINSTLALIGAIVAEFFGTPIVGMGFRISTEIGRMNVDMVWAEITVAAIAGSVFYGVVALVERATTFWHPSSRGG
ncbi:MULTISPECIES: ABC transporter permease [unclassified Rhizobium]|uniref:ABC transporter permease n=1 Tax=unclassified Rhizobium TaxID=2613769 RepID=UPI001ADC7237|nr:MULTISPECIES: ABC transporter permease [unclassified Rhizobium]MBO9099207.1 ABC transporter permease [Rhizobium sp. L58/93]MBO9131987.1 ABC transporter permease [Rhizobium sp. B209b/85]MBO9169469.1 ABC transporter permease [Rhizobium sp. L245/93]MBO9185420.1 ABC transporter permease [Rhizobium sp. E27B/91]QXZ85556.1 ABC transporter permease [Rhizobium sp. K1/93]